LREGENIDYNGDARTVVKEGCHIPSVAEVELVEVRFKDGDQTGSATGARGGVV
jgi:hypothetical protein